MRLGVVMPYWLDRPPLEALEIAGHAERLGYDSLWIGEMMTFDAFALGAAIARATTRLRLVVGPLPVSVRDPAALALGIASVNLFGGRPADLALGASTPAVVARWHGRDWQPTVTRMTETVAALRPILRGERSSFRGRVTVTDGFRLAAGAQPETRIAVAAFGPGMLRAAAAIADRIVVNLVTPAQLARFRDAIAAAAAEGGLPTAPPITAWVPVALEPDAAALSQIRNQLVLYVGQPGYGEMFADAGHGDVVRFARSGAHPREVASAITPALIGTVCVTGDPTRIAAGLDAYRAAGADEIAIVPVTADDPGGARVLAAARAV